MTRWGNNRTSLAPLLPGFATLMEGPTRLSTFTNRSEEEAATALRSPPLFPRQIPAVTLREPILRTSLPSTIPHRTSAGATGIESPS